ncbi:serine/threonine protein kinase [Streptomyces sp. RB6PN25]|uniref:non-specific serine/threonine protein kinase n=1 Tax=Streptomyces humicola TaxID=2953240 RepID=A0ABT1PUA3_9ACTN|nr:serine/threonine-protein kinase [Streptomyces humicola]MCQ4081255.1 serine/threonine protein kinase [Streptomyces humicola]
MDRTPGWGRNDMGGAGSLGGDRSFGGGAGVGGPGGTGGGAWAERADYGTGSSGGGGYAGLAAEADGLSGRLPEGFQLLRRAGTGRHSSVLLCREDATGQEVALKVLNLTVEDEGLRLAAHSELLSAGAAAKHPCSVVVEDAGFTPDNRPYLVEQFCQGGNAQSRLNNSGPFPVDEAIVIGIRLALSLSSAHRRGVLHLDVRPSNVLFNEAGDALLADHGIARIIQRSAPQLGALFDPMYAAREMFGWEKPGPSADIYSLGATLYALLNGLPAYAEAGSTSWSALYNEVLRGEFPPPNRHDVPPQLFDLITRMMSVNPEGRPPLNEVHRVLRMMLPAGYAARVPALDPEPEPEPMLPGWDPADDITPEEQAEAERIGAEAEAEAQRRRRMWIVSGTVLVLFAAAATGITWYLQQNKASKANAHASASPSASASASGSSALPALPAQGKSVPQSELAALMPQDVTARKVNGTVQVTWKAPKSLQSVVAYAAQAAIGTQGGQLKETSPANPEAVFTAAEDVQSGDCYVAASVVKAANGQLEYAAAPEICNVSGG